MVHNNPTHGSDGPAEISITGPGKFPTKSLMARELQGKLLSQTTQNLCAMCDSSHSRTTPNLLLFLAVPPRSHMSTSGTPGPCTLFWTVSNTRDTSLPQTTFLNFAARGRSTQTAPFKPASCSTLVFPRNTVLANFNVTPLF